MVRVNITRNKTTNNNSFESVFDAANDTIGLYLDTLYYFKGLYYITTAASATNHLVEIGFSPTQTPQEISYRYSWQSTTSATTTDNVGYFGVPFGVPLAPSFGTSTTSSQVIVLSFEGFLKSAGPPTADGGTITPVFRQTVAGTSAAPQVMAGSWFSIQPLSSGSSNIISGSWS